MRDFLLRASVLAAAAAAVLTELLGVLHLLRPISLALAWLALAAAAVYLIIRRPPSLDRFPVRPLEACIALACCWIAALAFLAAVFCPPNSHDVLAYHLPRIVYWAQAHTVGVFPTPYVNQIDFPPLAEYFMLHTYLLTGGDSLVNLVSWFSFVLTILGVSALAAVLRADSRAQALAALFAATLPSAILQASSAKNESLAAFWLVCVVYFAFLHDGLFLGLSLALAVFTKGTAYLYAPPLIAAAFFCDRDLFRWRRWRFIPLWAAGAVLLINGPLYIRNFSVSGSPFGFDSPFANGLYRYRNEPLGWKPAVSNVLLNLSDQLGSSSPQWNQGVYQFVLDLHRRLGINPEDPVNTLRMSRYLPPENTRHEANANNRWHLLLLVAASIYALGLALNRHRGDSTWLIYSLALAASYLFFCFYVRWQPWDARYLLGLFVVAAPLAGQFLADLRPRFLAAIVAVLLLSLARLPSLQNWLRPLQGPNNVFSVSRDAQYFADIANMQNQASYRVAVEMTARSACRQIGIDSSENQLEYPFEALLRDRVHGVRFVHTGVANPTARYANPSAPAPCAVLCLDCIGNRDKLALYAPAYGRPTVIGRFLLFQR